MNALESRLKLCERGKIKFSLLEAETIQQRLPSNKDHKNIVEVSKKFAKLMGKRNIDWTAQKIKSSMKDSCGFDHIY